MPRKKRNYNTKSQVDECSKRTSFLYQASLLVNEMDQNLARYYIKKMKNVANKKQLRL